MAETTTQIEIPTLEDIDGDEMELIREVTGLGLYQIVEIAEEGEKSSRSFTLMSALAAVAVQRQHPAWDSERVRKHIGKMKMLDLVGLFTQPDSGDSAGNGAGGPPTKRRSRSAAASGTSTTTTAPADPA